MQCLITRGAASSGLEEQTGRSTDSCCLRREGHASSYSHGVSARLTDSALDVDAIQPHHCLPQYWKLPALKREYSLTSQGSGEKQPHFAHLLNSLLKSAIKAQINIIHFMLTDTPC